jgi:hypothetical protein
VKFYTGNFYDSLSARSPFCENLTEMAESVGKDVPKVVTPLVARGYAGATVVFGSADSLSLAACYCLTAQGIKCLKERLCQDKETATEILSKSADKRNLLMFQYANSYTFQAAMAHHQVVHSCIQPHVQTFYQTPYVEMSQVLECMIISMDMYTVIRAAVKFWRVHQ